ncbi:MAG: methyltransferase domain-containing protein [bacterium]
MSGERPTHDIFEENFGKTAEFGRLDEGLSRYRAGVFYDDFAEKPPGEEPCVVTNYSAEGESKKRQATIQELEPIEGGFDHFVKDGKSTLDLGSGSGAAVREMAQLNPNGRFVGLDMRYSKESVELPDTKNAYLVGGTWSETSFKEDTFDRIVSFRAFPYHLGRTQTSELTDEQLADKTINEITRTAQKGCIWRGRLASGTKRGDSRGNAWRVEVIFPRLMTKYGWELTTIEGNDANEVFIAKLTDKDKSTQTPTPQQRV